MDVGAVSFASSNHLVSAIDVINTNSAIMRSNCKPVSIWGVFHYFVPLFGVSEGVDDVIDVIVVSSDGDLTFVVGDGYVTVVGVDSDCSGALVWRVSG